jgi:anti-anti-sigma factor
MRTNTDFSIAMDCADGVLALHGDFDMDSVEAFEEALDRLLDADPPKVIVDLHDLTFLSSTGLGCLIRAQRRCNEVVLRRPRRSHLRLLTISGLDTAFPIEKPEPDEPPR